tara:strand:+ start:669 stop:1478 length:810 start_codon:yes stop_codon:yes gene_type:complete
MQPTNTLKGGLRERKIFKTSSKSEPLITIITVVLNNEKYLQECLDSLHNQKYKNYEHIIIDGGSNDKTIDILKKNENKIDFWISEKDQGIYDAFNKGMKLANGDFIGFLNSDDIYYSENTLNYVLEAFEKNKNINFIFGPVKKHWALLHGYKPWKIHFTWGFYTSHSTGFFIKSKSAEEIGEYNLKYKYSSDYDYFFRMIVHKKFKGIGVSKDKIFGIFRRGGFSSRVKFLDHFKEEIRIRNDNKQNKIIIFLIIVYKSIRHIKKIINN